MSGDRSRIDQRTFADLMREAEAVVRSRCPDWTPSVGEPGTTLIEIYAYLTETMLYRVNRLPDRLQVALLKLLGVSQMPPAAAVVRLEFSRDAPAAGHLVVPRGTRVSDPSGEVVFTTVEDAAFAPEATEASARGLHAEAVEGALLGHGTGRPGQSLAAARAPFIRPSHITDDLRIGVEVEPGEVSSGAHVIGFGGKSFLLWEERPSFAAAPDARAFVADRSTGRILFGPHAPLSVPPPGREVRAWYLTGGGRAGNVAAGTLTSLRSPIPGIRVTNPERAAGGEDGETEDQVLIRGREAVRAVDVAVTAEDFERTATAAGGISRARAYAQKEVWVFGTPGAVEILVLPKVEADAQGAITADRVAAERTPDLLARVGTALDARRPLGVRCVPKWATCRPVSVSARIAAAPHADARQLEARLVRKLNGLLSPTGNWPFGKVLRASDVYETILGEAGVRYAERVALRIDDAPSADVEALLRDPVQPRCFFAATAAGVYRSLDDGGSWARVAGGDNTRFEWLAADADVPGRLAAVGARDGGWLVTASDNGGESWEEAELIAHPVLDIDWMRRDGRSLILVAARNGLFQIDRAGPRGLSPVPVAGPEKDAHGFFAVASGISRAGTHFLAVAARGRRGVYLSAEAGAEGTFTLVPGSEGHDVRSLVFHRHGGQLHLWAAVWAEGGEAGEGLMRIGARSGGIDPAGWTVFANGWKGGSCRAFDFAGPLVVAGSRDGGALTLDLTQKEPAWRAPLLDCGLPIDTERARLLPITAVAADARSGRPPILFAGGANGLFRGDAETLRFKAVGSTVFTDHAPLPPNWLYCAAPHALEIVGAANHDEE
jgi:hypothetical protein